MDLATVIGLALAFIGIIGGNVLEGGNPGALFNIPGLMIVFIGSFGAMMISQPMSVMVGLPKFLMKAFFDFEIFVVDHMRRAFDLDITASLEVDLLAFGKFQDEFFDERRHVVV